MAAPARESSRRRTRPRETARDSITAARASRRRKAASPSELLAALERIRSSFGGDAARAKLELLKPLGRARLTAAGQVARLHESLCFLMAYPDDAPVLAQTAILLGGFADRPDLRRHARALTNSGITGTPIEFRFFWPTARWLARRWGDRITIQWPEFENRARLETFLPLLAHPAETPGLDEYAFSTRQWIRRMKRPRETDAAFLIRRFDQLAIDDFAREGLWDELDVPIRLRPGPDTPSRTLPARREPQVVYPRRLTRRRPDLARELERPPIAVRGLPRREAEAYLDLAREAMVVRSRDLDVFAWGDPDDVRLIDDGDGLSFVAIGAIPERRLLLESVYGFLTLKNRIPIGYVLTSALFGSSEIAYNVFETWRGTEAAAIYARVLAVTRHLFGSDTFTIYPYQLGEGNAEALATGAWWFYYKLGFRPRDRGVQRLVREEVARLRRDPSHRSGIPTLERLAVANLYYTRGRPRDDVIGMIPLASVGLAVTDALGARFGSDRARAARTCAREAAELLGVRPLRGWTRGERIAWERWAPLVLLLPGITRWSPGEKRALIGVIRAKGGRRESDFVRRFDGHARLKRAVRALAERTRVD